MLYRIVGLVALTAIGAFLLPASSVAGAMRQAVLSEPAPGDFVRVGACADATPGNADAIANIGFIVGRDAVAVIDPGGSLADGQSLRAAIKATTRLPIRYVIMTHVHPDHVFGGAAFLPDHPVYVGHWRLPAALATRESYDHRRLAALLGDAATGQPVSPTLLVHTTLTLDLGARTLTLTAYGPAHTETDLTILDEATGTLWAGDLVFSGRIPSLDGDLKGWISTLHQLEKVRAARVIPGHGPASLPWPQGADDEMRYLTTLLHDVRASIAAGQDIGEAVGADAASEQKKWQLFDQYNGHNVTVAYKELQWE